MVTRNPAWRKNRPLEWAKPGYWLPPVHLEANVLDEYTRRVSAILRGKKEYSGLLVNHVRQDHVSSVLSSNATAFHVSTRSSTHMPLPDKSIDVIITDPPYGSYVHYADLCNFWAVWLPEIEGLGQLIDTTEEAVVARKQFPTAKNLSDYQILLERVFCECSRVLKSDGYMVLTFHNREPRAWAALLIAAVKAGFELPSNGIMFQDGVASYKHTSQSRRPGSVIGDFVLSFRLAPAKMESAIEVLRGAEAWEAEIVSIALDILEQNGPLSPNELFARLYAEFLSRLLSGLHGAVNQGEDVVQSIAKALDQVHIFDSHRKQLLERHFEYQGGKWSVANNHGK